MFAFLRALGLTPIEWEQAVRWTGKAAPYIGDVLEAGFSRAQAAVVLLSGDDLAKLDPSLLSPTDPPYERELTPQARPNVLFEAGYALAKYPNRSLIVEFGKLRPFSDVLGKHAVRFQNTADSRNAMASRLESAGCRVNRTGNDWLRAGDFSQAALGEADSPVLEDWVNLLSGSNGALVIVSELPPRLRGSFLVVGQTYHVKYQQEPCVWIGKGAIQNPAVGIVREHVNRAGPGLKGSMGREQSEAQTDGCYPPGELKMVLMGLPVTFDASGSVWSGTDRIATLRRIEKTD